MFKPQYLDGWATHLPTLLKAVGLTTGPVLEVGCGMYSTFCLHGVCQNRRLVSLETDPRWFDRFTSLRTETHEVRHADAYHVFNDLYAEPWDVVLIDHAPAWRRRFEAAKVAHARYVVMHDTESAEYDWQKVLPLFRYVWTDRRFHPWTTVASNSDPLEAFRSSP